MRILVADGDADHLAGVVTWLRTHGYEVKHALTAERFRVTWIEYQPDLVVVQDLLAGVDTLELCRDLRLKHDALVLAIGTESDAGTHIRCLESGADAFVIKPFVPAMLLAHIHALSRRRRNALLDPAPPIVSVAGFHIDSLRHEVHVQGKRERLTPTESKMLYLLATNAGNVCTLPQIVAHVWGYGDKSDTSLVRAHIRHLREKIEDDPSRPIRLVTIPGSGYMFVSPVGDADEDACVKRFGTQTSTVPVA